MRVSFNGLYKFFDKKENGTGLQTVPISLDFKWSADLADEQLLSGLVSRMIVFSLYWEFWIYIKKGLMIWN